MTSTLQSAHKLGINILASSVMANSSMANSRALLANVGAKRYFLLAPFIGLLLGMVGCSGTASQETAPPVAAGSITSSSSSVTSSSSSSVTSSSSSSVTSSSSSSSTASIATVPTQYPKDGYCNTAGTNWAWCEDFDGQGTNGPAAFVPANSGIQFQSHSHTTMTGTLCESTLAEGKDCNPYVQGGALMLNPEDSGFGMNVLRVQQPFDFAGREGHIHYTSDLRGHLRMHQSVHIGPAISNSLPDLRFINVIEALNMGSAIDIDFVGDGGEPFNITLWKNGQNLNPGYPLFHAYGPFATYAPPLANFVKGNVHDVDIYLSRAYLRIAVDGIQVFNQAIPDLGFDRGYVYFAQLAYNPHKDGYVGDAGNRFMWDNFAFDGPSLPKNSLTPADKQDILFRAFDKKSCTVRGVAADGPVNPSNNHIFDTWHTQIGINDAPITLSDIQCVSSGGTPSLGQADIGNIQVIKR